MQLIQNVAQLHKMASVQAAGLLAIADAVYAYAVANPDQLQLVLNIVPPQYMPVVNAVGAVAIIVLRSIHQPALACPAPAVPAAAQKGTP